MPRLPATSRTALRSVLLFLSAGVVLAGTTLPALASSPSPSTVAAARTTKAAAVKASADVSPKAPADFRLQKSSHNDVIPDLDKVLPRPKIADVIRNDANRDATKCSPPASNLLAGFCWNSGDNGTEEWYPQGITTTADADPSGSYDGATSVVTSWYSKATDGIQRGVRLSFVNYANPDAPKYRHVLLVEPVRTGDGKPSYKEVRVHAGGIVWYGPYIYVVDTYNGVRVFDLNHVYEVTATGDKTKIGLQSDGTYQAFNYKYVLPQAFGYKHTTAGGQDPMIFSFGALDRTSSPDSLVTGEYLNPGTGTQLARWPFDESTHLLKESDDGYVHATEEHPVNFDRMQGALAIDGKYYVSRSNGSSTKGDLGTWTPGGSVKWHTGAQPIGCEDLSFWQSKDQLWGLAEYPGKRSVYAMKASAF